MKPALLFPDHRLFSMVTLEERLTPIPTPALSVMLLPVTVASCALATPRAVPPPEYRKVLPVMLRPVPEAKTMTPPVLVPISGSM